MKKKTTAIQMIDIHPSQVQIIRLYRDKSLTAQKLAEDPRTATSTQDLVKMAGLPVFYVELIECYANWEMSNEKIAQRAMQVPETASHNKKIATMKS